MLSWFYTLFRCLFSVFIVVLLFFQDLENTFDGWTGDLAHLTLLRESLSCYISAEDLSVLQERIELLHRQWDEICHQVHLLAQYYFGFSEYTLYYKSDSQKLVYSYILHITQYLLCNSYKSQETMLLMSIFTIRYKAYIYICRCCSTSYINLCLYVRKKLVFIVLAFF